MMQHALLIPLSVAGNQYLTSLTLYFIGYVLFEVSSSLDALHDWTTFGTHWRLIR